MCSVTARIKTNQGRPKCETGVVTFPDGSGNTPVLVMKTANVREGDDLSSFLSLDEARLRALLFQHKMGSCRVVVSEVIGAENSQGVETARPHPVKPHPE